MIIKTTDINYLCNIRKIRKNKKIVFTNGCFDIVHLGHMKMFNYIRKNYPDAYIVVGLNSDESVDNLKKSHRRIFDENYRSAYMSNIVDSVIIFNQSNPSGLILDLLPDIVVKGKEYEGKEFPELPIIKHIGADIIYYNSNIDMSTTKLIELVKERT